MAKDKKAGKDRSGLDLGGSMEDPLLAGGKGKTASRERRRSCSPAAPTPKKDAQGAAAAEPTPSAPVVQAPQILASLPLQILIHFNSFIYPPLWILTLALLIYKGTVFPYATAAYPLEVFALFPWAAIEASRLNKRNKTEEAGPVAIFLVLTVMACFIHLFYLLWQSYVLLFDVILNSVSLGLILGELITGIMLIANLAKAG
ncbi:hypothetical protein BC831DRAFT_515212 [Entophlyctis helioformis]|nr:hypothetical protein BC831DRAFT_515212 [Entophlyctis helioformis]